jgi:hypothetical protein
MKRKKWQVWLSDNDENTIISQLKSDMVLFEGCETKARKFYKDNNHKYNKKLHIGYLLD